MSTSKNKRVAIVTGGAGGIGAAISQRLAAEGFDVVITYNSNASRAENLAKALPSGNHHAFHAPTTDAGRVSSLSEFVDATYGKLDLLVNIAGITTPVPHHDLESLTDEWIDKIMQTNVRGSFAMVRACKHLLARSNGLIVNISSVAAVTGIGSNVAYCASKAALDSMTRSLARALAPEIRVVSVSPGWVLGDYAKTMDPAYINQQENKTPLGRLATPDDVANTVHAVYTYLTFTTGSVIPVDGGRTLG